MDVQVAKVLDGVGKVVGLLLLLILIVLVGTRCGLVDGSDGGDDGGGAAVGDALGVAVGKGETGEEEEENGGEGECLKSVNIFMIPQATGSCNEELCNKKVTI